MNLTYGSDTNCREPQITLFPNLGSLACNPLLASLDLVTMETWYSKPIKTHTCDLYVPRSILVGIENSKSTKKYHKPLICQPMIPS